MNDKNKTTLKIVLVILLGVALLVMLISCCVVGTKRGFKNSVSYATENPQLTFVGLDTVLSSYNGVTFYGIRFNSKDFEDYNYDSDFFNFTIIGNSTIFNCSFSGGSVNIKTGSDIVAVLDNYTLNPSGETTYLVSEGFNITSINDEETAPYIIELCTTPLVDNPTSESLNIVYFNKLSNGQWDTVENNYKSLGNSFFVGNFTDSAGSVIFNSKSIQDFIYYSIINRDGEVTNDYPFYYKDNKKVQLIYCPPNLAFSIAYNKASLKKYDSAYQKGFSDGYSSAVSAGTIIGDTTTFLKTTFTNLGTLLDVKIFGNVTLGTIIGIPLILMVVLAVLKLVRG